ncbi:APC family permease [Williamsoniiplasma lucivorax]|nr:APC family permease [Williamsoniiplasma lucivorax]
MKNKKRLFEFLTIFTAVVGTMVGAGIYVKNDNGNGHVLGNVQNPIMAIILWGIMAVVLVFTIIVFLEIASSTTKDGNGTLANWARKFWNRRIASGVSIFFTFIYLPMNYAFFSTLIVQYLMQAAGVELNLTQKYILYLIVPAIFILFMGAINSYARTVGKHIQIFGTFFKFIPLFLVFVAFIVPDTTWGVLFGTHQDIGTGNSWSTSFENLNGVKVLSGFAPILFAFNGFIYAANMQSETEHRDVVAKGILFGVLFTGIFYVLIAFALFTGSKDGSVVSFFTYLFSGFNDLATVSSTTKNMAVLFSNLILVSVTFLGVNSYTLTGTNNIYTDTQKGILWSNSKFIRRAHAGMIQAGIGLIYLFVWIPVSLAKGQQPGYMLDQMSNFGATICFTIYTMLVVLAMVNRKTNKVEVSKMKNGLFWISAIIATTMLSLIIAFQIYDYFSSSEIIKPIMAGVVLGVFVVVWITNEILICKKPINLEQIELLKIKSEAKESIIIKRRRKEVK